MHRRSLPFRLRPGTLALGLVSSCAVLCLSWRAAAQAEAQKPTPNVLLLVDSSGSMEFKTDGAFPTCIPGSNASQKSRWINLVEVLTGTINNYSCWAEDRSTTAFKNEFSVGGVTPYDFGYVNPYHRALSNSCIYGPGVLPAASSPYLWPTGAVNTFPFATGAVSRTQPGACSPTFSQAGDGLLDIYKDEVRFGLMTFDARVSGGTGVTSTGSADNLSGVDGNWSYPPNGPTRQGHPANCTYEVDQEVGARNAAAPPWEGRMVAFGPPDLADNTQRNNWIQEVLLSTRPYGATPIAGQLFDAQHFLWDDHDADPFNTATQSYEFGPRVDRNWGAANCRKTILVLLTDGEPNLDLRPFCEAQPPDVVTGGTCPYDKPEDIVKRLRESPPEPNFSVETYVIGFALGTVAPYHPPLHPPVECKDLDLVAECDRPENNDFAAYPPGKGVQACCTLNHIAAAGGLDASGVAGRKAYFANDATQLKAIFTDILDDVVQVATRTMPVFSSSGGDSQSNGFKFFSAFDPQPDPAGPQLWQGTLERHRFVCDELEPVLDDYSPAKGDDFAGNVNANGDDRWFYSVVGSGGFDTRKSIRPDLLSDTDGLGLSSGTQVFASDRSALKSVVTAADMQVTASTCTAAPTANGCRDLILDHLVGVTTPGQESRCVNGVCRLFGGIYHSTPTVVPGRPGEFLRDESYQNFGKVMAADARPSVLYTSTVDGFLHAFNLAPFPGSDDAEEREIDGPGNNELWSFIPPAVLPVLQTQYPSTPAILLDGVPIIKDVVSTGANRFERVQNDAQAGTGAWRSVLVQGFGEGQVDGGYFALDITKPDRDDGPPRFLWQLTRDAAGNPLFGNGGTPLITTVFLDAASGGAREVAVAVLPGGDLPSPGGEAATAGPRLGTDVGQTEFDTNRKGRLYTGQERARSLTIVRLDTGEVLRTFRPSNATGTFSSTVFTLTDIQAPITGQPKAYPENTGAVADRIFVGDRDGKLWRVDVSSKDPANWSMKIFFDAFYEGDYTHSQPVILPPVVSVTDTGAVTVNFATGDQEVTSAPSTMVNRVVSLTEKLNTTNDFVSHLNWIHELSEGDRVTGPMVLFNSGLYYSVSRPPNTTTAACDVGSSKVFGTHYVQSADFQADTDPPDPLNGPGKAPDLDDKLIASRTDGLIFGLSLQPEPTCSSTPDIIAGNESFGSTEVTMSTAVNPGKMFLSYNVSGTNAGDSGVEQVKTELTSPNIPVTFQSWALVYE